MHGEVMRLTSICVGREVARPFDVCAALELAACDRVATDGAQDGGVAELRLSRDDLVED